MVTKEKKITVKLNESELSFIVQCGFALIENLPEKVLPTYTNFNKKQIIDFSAKMRRIMDENDMDL